MLTANPASTKEHKWIFSAYRKNSQEFIVICNRPSDNVVIVLIVRKDGTWSEYPKSQALPDIRLMLPSPWLRVPPVGRAQVRAYLTARYAQCKCGDSLQPHNVDARLWIDRKLNRRPL